MMRGRLISALGALLIASTGAFAAGTIPGISMTQQLDELAKPLSGGKLYLIQAGTTSTPQNCYQDTGLSLAWPNPVTLDAAGRVPQLFCADGNIKIRLTDKNGVQKLVQDNLLIVGPSGGGGGGGTVDPTTIFQTGAFMQFYGTGNRTGWVRCNARTIGSASSGATERANADVQALFEYLWSADANLTVSGGRGASANADWLANKTLQLPDCRGRMLAGLADMGNSTSSILSGVTFNTPGTSTTLGSTAGAAMRTLTTNQMPQHRHSVFLIDPGHTHTSNAISGSTTTGGGGFSAGANTAATINSATTGISITSGDGVPNATLQAGGGAAFEAISPTILATTYIKL
ncbi:hypothetical protein [Bradyrhizobium sp. CB2312]|uniref:hypothetical protein n=1 Tax=Bradyrhizobium sp. CB2312 TaxID=3039155 RepID=UPI0024B1DDB7|nr:hypothetical protein [Bradyrhizobium sp. CB2312]WFU68588.1 hypothetical protein QA642_25000 [Bradyrhizobium sp. CB2312]